MGHRYRADDWARKDAVLDDPRAGLGEHITAMVRNHAAGDDAAFYSVALQIAAREARQGHHILADNMKKAVDASRERVPLANVTALPRVRGDFAELVEASRPQVHLRELVAPSERTAEIKQLLAEQRQRKICLSTGSRHRTVCSYSGRREPERR